MENYGNSIFDDHQKYNRFLSIEGNRVNESGTKPSIYITEKKIKTTINEMSVNDMAEILKSDNAVTPLALERNKKRLNEKLERLHEWQLLHALQVMLTVGRIECVAYIEMCKRTDKQLK